jgi:hypothetical protein
VLSQKRGYQKSFLSVSFKQKKLKSALFADIWIDYSLLCMLTTFIRDNLNTIKLELLIE